MPVLILLIIAALAATVHCIYKTLAVFLPTSKKKKIVISAIFAIPLTAICFYVGNFALALFFNLFIIFILTRIVLLVFRLPFVRKVSPLAFEGFDKIFALFIIFISVTITICGYYNCSNIQTTHYTKTVSGKNFEDTRIMFVSDIHANEDNYIRIASNIKKCADREKPDVIIIGGDLTDSSTYKKHLKYFAQLFEELSTNANIIYVNGNHDIMSSPHLDNAYISDTLQKSSVTVLADESTVVNQICFIGRNDYASHNYGNVRKDISELLPSDKSLATVVIDHQPKELKYLKKLGVDLSLSGHTHNGQLFPFGVICELAGINEMQYGIHNDGNFSAIVSSGAGTWGMQVRTQGVCEIVIVDMKHR